MSIPIFNSTVMDRRDFRRAGGTGAGGENGGVVGNGWHLMGAYASGARVGGMMVC